MRVPRISPLEQPLAPAVQPDRAAPMARILAYLVVAGLFVGAAWAYRQGFYKGQPFPRNTFLFQAGDHFNDLFNLLGPVERHDPYSFPTSNYFPFSYLVVYPFTWLGRTGDTVAWTVLVVGGLSAFVARQLDFMARADRWAVVVALTVMNYAFLITFDRGNLEGIVTLLIAGMAYSLQTGRRGTAALCIAAAGAMKGYPLLFAAIFLVRRDWRSLGIVVSGVLVLSFLGTVFYGFDIVRTIDLLRPRLDFYREAYMIGDAGLGYGVSLFGPLKLLVVDVFGGNQDAVRSALTAYTVGAAILAVGLVVALWRLRLELWQQVTLLIIAYDVLPQVSGGYKLLHLVVPIGMFLRFGTRDRFRWFYVCAFALLLMPKAYYLLRSDGTNVGVVVDPLVMTAVGLVMLSSAVGGDRGEASSSEAGNLPAGAPASAG
jgi:hypothetical protein